MTQQAQAPPPAQGAPPQPTAAAEPPAPGDATMEAFGDALVDLMGTPGEQGPEASPPGPAETAQPAAETAAGADGATSETGEGDAPGETPSQAGQRRSEVEPPKTWRDKMAERRAASAARKQQALQEAQAQRALLERLSAIEARLGQPQQAVPTQLAQALRGGSEFEQLQALAAATGKPIEEYIGAAAHSLLRGGATDTQPAGSKPAAGAEGALVKQLLAKVAQLEQQQQQLPERWQQQQLQQQQQAAIEADWTRLARIPMLEEDAAKFPNIATTHKDVLHRRIYAMVTENAQLPPDQRFSLIDIATTLDKELGELYAYRESRLSGTGAPAGSNQETPPANRAGNQAASQGQGTPAEANPANPTAITNRDGATVAEFATEEDRMRAASRMLAEADFAFSTVDS